MKPKTAVHLDGDGLPLCRSTADRTDGLSFRQFLRFLRSDLFAESLRRIHFLGFLGPTSSPEFLPEGRRLETRPGGRAPSKEPVAIKHRQISSGEIAGQYRKTAREFQACYVTALQKDRTLKEVRVDVTMEVSAPGRVQSVRVKSSASKEMKACLKRVIKGWAFKPSGEQTILFPLVFRDE